MLCFIAYKALSVNYMIWFLKWWWVAGISLHYLSDEDAESPRDWLTCAQDTEPLEEAMMGKEWI